jgi:hypothetical protein
MYLGPGHDTSFNIVSKTGGYLTKHEIVELRTLCETHPELANVRRPSTCGEDGFEWDGTTESAMNWVCNKEKRLAPTHPAFSRTPFHVRANNDHYADGRAQLRCTQLRCKFGTPFRKMWALLDLCRAQGYTIVSTRGFKVLPDGTFKHSKGCRRYYSVPSLRA